MRIDDICLVVSDVDRSDAFYSTLGLERRMRNVRFVDFRLGDGARLAMWVQPSIAETVGASYPLGPGMPFTVSIEAGSAAPGVLTDPDGFTIIRNRPTGGVDRLTAATLTVGDLPRSAAFLETLGFRESSREMSESGSRSRSFDGGTMTLTITLDPPALPALPALPGSPALPASHATAAAAGTGRVMLAIELETGPQVDALWSELRSQGLADAGPPRVFEWGSRSAYFVDHDGYIWEIYAWVEMPR